MHKKNPFFEELIPNFSGQLAGTIITQFSNPGEEELKNFQHENILLLPAIGMVPMPEMPQPLKLEGELAFSTASEAFAKDKPVFVTTVVGDVSKLSRLKDFNPIGVIAKIAKIVKLPDGSQIAFLNAFNRAFLEKIVKKKPFLLAAVSIIDFQEANLDSQQELPLMLESLENIHKQILAFLPEEERESLNLSVTDPLTTLLRKLYGMAMSSPLSIDEKLMVLGANSINELLDALLKGFDMARQRLAIQASIHMRTHENLSLQQKELFLKQQMRSIQEELGESSNSSDYEELTERAKGKKWNKKAHDFFEKELKKLEKLNSSTPEYSVQFSYLETLLDLPWENYSPDDFTLAKVEKILDRDHYGLEKVKERILEQMAVIKLRNDLKAPILCLYGPPGVGKTSLGKSIADALGREYARISLGGIHDEAEIRGHRRTYIGAMPGRIMASLSKCGTGNPVFVLDEIDKIRKDFKGDPSTALLEVLDPEQNSSFHDNYVDFDYDLSKVLFIATANDIGEISRPLLDRMELIEINGYSPEEKIEIALRHLVSKSLEENGFSKDEISFEKSAINYIINRYTRESGVRQLEKKISKVLRKIARLKASNKNYPSVINTKKVKEYLGIEEVNPDAYEGNKYAGVVTGLAWTQTGGEILFIETSLSRGKGDKLTLTGNLGDVMKESAVIAMEYIKSHSSQFDIDPTVFDKVNVHVHVPEGAVPKDGPSAGITIVTSLISALTGRKVREKLAMTGEITLRGKVLPVGGIKEKILAAKRAGITDIILSKENKRNIEEINPRYIKGLDFHFVDSIEDVVDFALLDEKAEKYFEL